MSFLRVGPLDSLWPGEMKGVVLGHVKVLLVNLDGRVVAYEDRCAHRGMELCRGKLDGDTLTCRAHEWQYDVLTGAGKNPKGVMLRRFPVRIESNEIWVDVAAAAVATAALERE